MSFSSTTTSFFALQTTRLTRWGGIITGFARTYSKALNASRAEIIHAVDGDDPVETLVMINGHRGTDHPAGASNRIASDAHPGCEGVDQVFIATTPEQFETLAETVGADVSVQ